VIVVLSGPGGVGKGTVVQRLVAVDDRLHLSRSWTTRARREGEAADAYTFVDRATFEAQLARGGYLEHDEFLGNLYGTPAPEVVGDEAHDHLLEINVAGARQVRERYPDALVIFLVPPSREVQEERLRRRGDPEEHVRRRLAIADAEEAEGRRLADAIVVNDELDRAVREVAGILAGRRART
jgi:guanylate kinase